MFTSNFGRLIAHFSSAPHNEEGNTMLPLISTTGTNIYASNRFYSNDADSYNAVLIGGGIFLGDSDAAVDVDQYNIQGNLIQATESESDGQLGSVKTFSYDAKGVINVLYKVTVTPTTDFTVKEFALIRSIFRNNSKQGLAMIAREVLKEPIPLLANQTYDLQFRVKMNFN